MNLKKIMSAVLASVMLITSCGAITAGAEENIPDTKMTSNREADTQNDYSAYLFAYFRDNREETLCYGVSRNGYTFRALNGGEVNVDEGKAYEVKVMIWEKDTMTPMDGYSVINETISANN